jgi:hypothetical protein
MKGRAKAAQDRFRDGISQAWHTEAFAREKRLRPLSKYLMQTEGGSDRGGAALLGMLRSMKRQGAPITIRKLK